MAANRQPIWTKEANTGVDNGTTMSPTLTTAAADYTGISANNALVCTAGSEDTFVVGLMFKAIGTNVASVARMYVNNGATPATATNNDFVDEISLPATTASAVAATAGVPWYFGQTLAGSINNGGNAQRLYVGLGTTVAAGWRVSKIEAKNF